MRLQRQSNQQIITLDPTSILGCGGEAHVYMVPQDQTLAAKVYHQPRDARKLIAMLANPPADPMTLQGHISITWPVDLLRTVDGSSDTVVGFLMPRVTGMHSIFEFYNSKTRRQNCPLFNYRYLHRTARNLAAAVGALHARDYCIGDVNESNILVNDTGLVTLIDTDSFQMHDPRNGIVYRCGVGKLEFTPPELQGKSFAHIDRATEHDLFGLAVLIFQLLMEGIHPFSGVFQGPGDPPPYSARIVAGHFCYSRERHVPYIPTPTAAPFEILHPTLQKLFGQCFEDGHSHPQIRPSAQVWQAALQEAEDALVICADNIQHRYGNHLNACPWCKRTLALAGRDPFPSQLAVQSKHHLQPLALKQRPLPTKICRARNLPRLTPPVVTTILRKKRRCSPFVFGLLSLAVVNSLEVLVIVNHDFKFAANTSAPPTLSNQRLDCYKLRDNKRVIEDFSQTLHPNPNDTKAVLSQDVVPNEIAQYSKKADESYWEGFENLRANAEFLPEKIDDYQQAPGNFDLEIAASCNSVKPVSTTSTTINKSG